MSSEAASAVAFPTPSGRRGVLLVNVGTPDAPTAPAVRKYLREFLGDPKVIDLPAPGRWLLLNAIILPFRPRKSAHAYQQIWTPEGSPLLLNSRAQRDALAKGLPEVPVALGMRYGNPSLRSAMEELRAQGASEITLVPLYPQYADATTGTTEEAFRALNQGAAHSITPPFFLEPGFIKAQAMRVREVVKAEQPQTVVFSYHGLPIRQVKKVCSAECSGLAAAPGACGPLGEANARCYRAQCFATTQAIAREGGFSSVVTSFQSRIKGTNWLGPHTDQTVATLARQGVRRAAIVCPSFVADCLETLEEIGQRAAATFREAGGESLTLVPAVNDDPTFIAGLATMIRRHWAQGPAPTPGEAA